MSKKTKKAMSMLLVVALIAVIAVGGMLAYLTSEDSDVNVMTLGNVDIDQIEVFEQGADLYPGVTVTKEVSVKNVGDSAAYVRTLVAFETINANGFGYTPVWNTSDVNATNLNLRIDVDGVTYDVWEVVYTDAVAPGAEAAKSLMSVKLSEDCTNEHMEALGGTYEVLVLSQAVQTNGFANARAALDTAFGVVNTTNATKWFEGVKGIITPDYIVTAATTNEEIQKMFADGGVIYFEHNTNLANLANANNEIVLNKDVGILAEEGVKLSFNKTVKLTGEGVLTVYGGSLETSYELCTTDNATLVIKGGEHSFGAFSATSNGKIVVDDGVLNCKGTYAGVLGASFAENGQMIVNGGIMNMHQPFNLNANRCDKAYVEINGGEINLLNGADKLFAVRNIMEKDRTSGVLRGSSIKITGGTFTTTYQLDSDGDANAFIRNEDGNADTNRVLVSNTYKGELEYNCVVTGGTFYGCWQRSDNQRYTNGNGGYSDGLLVENSIAGFVAAGYQITGDSTNGYIVTQK